MNYIKAYGESLTAEQYIRLEVTSSRGAYSKCSKAELIDACTKHGIIVSPEDTKTALYDKLITNKVYTPKDFCKMYNIGIKGNAYMSEFNLRPEDVIGLAKIGCIHTVGTTRSLTAGKTNKELLFDVYEFVNMEEQTVRELLSRISPKNSKKI